MSMRSGKSARGLALAFGAMAAAGIALGGAAAPAAAKSKIDMLWDNEIKNDAPKVTYNGPTITLRHSHFIPRNAAVAGDLHQKWVDWMEARSNGKLKIRIYWTNQLSDATRGAFEAVSKGITDTSQCYPWFDPGRFNLWLGLHMPGIVERSTAGGRAMMEIYQEHLRKEYEAQGVQLTRISPTPPNRILSRDVPILLPADMKGKKLWATGDIPSRVAAAVGATAVPLTPQDLYVSYQTGVIDVMQMHNAGSILFRVAELSKFRNPVGLSVNPTMVCINPKFFEGLPPDIKALYARGIQLYNHAESQTYFDEFAADAVKQMDKMGIKLVQPTAEQEATWLAAFRHVEGEWVAEMEKKGLGARKMFADYRAAYGKLDGMTDDQIFDLVMDKPVNLIGDYKIPPK
ncbi:MAG: TRAP transporter substrate-binding protein DctP [Alphaproteobacteria bacterium]